MVNSSFANQKILKFIITLGDHTFNGGDNDQVTFEGYRSIVEIDNGGGAQTATLRAKIYGVSQSDMLSITTLQWLHNSTTYNTIDVFAVDGSTQTLVFTGMIVNAWGDYANVPDVFLNIQANHTYEDALLPATCRSYPGLIPVTQIMQDIANAMGLNFESNGVTTLIRDEYLSGTNRLQAQQLAHDAGLGLFFDLNTLAITSSPTTPRLDYTPPLVSSQTGMIGYPTLDVFGVWFQTIFNPSIVFGKTVTLQTNVPQAAGRWFVTNIQHKLDCEKPGGQWMSLVRAYSTASGGINS